MRRSGLIIGLGLLVALAGCSGKRYTDKTYTDKTELARDYVAAMQSGDKGKVMAMIYTKGLSSEDLELNDQSTQMELGIATWPAVKGLQIQKIEENAPTPSQLKLKEYQGLPLHFAITPTTFFTVCLGGETAKSAQMVCPIPVFEREGQYWVCPIAYKTEADYLAEDTAVKKGGPPPVSYPDNVELSKTKEVSIVRLSITKPKAWGFNMSYTDDLKLIVKAHADCTTLRQAIMGADPDGDWFDGLGLLPEGFFTIEVKNLPKDQKTIYQNIVEAFEVSFNLKITREEHVWDGYEIVVPEKLPVGFTKSSESSTGYDGNSFKGYTMRDLADWLEGKIGGPVEITQDFDGQRFDYYIPIWDEDDKEIKGLEYMGFKVEPKKLTRMTVLITKNPGK